jgi:eukaryotic-like serine/threonine-protein kinase
MLETGQVIEGKYRITRLIGTGGMGAVYEGENVLIRRRVAIKVLHADSAANGDIIRRFEREAQAAGEIGNDHILEVLDLGALPNGDRFMVMEYLDGETLAQRIERFGRLTPQQVAPIARQFLTALIAAHAAGIIHRDLKPENVFVLRSKAGRTDFVKLIDFGVSKFSRPFKEGEHRMTRANAVLGTPCYMSPEQARGASETDVRSDIYSCGVILFESVTGRLPFEGESFNDLMFKIALSDAPSILDFVPNLDPEFAAIVGRACAREPAARYATAQDFADALDGWMRAHRLTESLSAERPSDAFPPRADAASAASIGSNTPTMAAENEGVAAVAGKRSTDESWAQSGAGMPVRPPRGGRRVVAILGAAGLLALLGGVATFARSRPAAPPAMAASPLPLPAATLSTPPAIAAITPPAEASQTLAPIAAPPVEPAPPASTPRHRPEPSAPRPATHSPNNPSQKQKPASSSGGFDLGY